MSYPRLPEFGARFDDEHAEAYGLRALAFVVAHEVTATVPTDALQMADHVFGLAVSARDLHPHAATRLAVVHSLITATIRRRDAEQATPAAPEPGTPAPGRGGSPNAPVLLAPRPMPPAPPSHGAPITRPRDLAPLEF